MDATAGDHEPIRIPRSTIRDRFGLSVAGPGFILFKHLNTGRETTAEFRFANPQSEI